MRTWLHAAVDMGGVVETEHSCAAASLVQRCNLCHLPGSPGQLTMPASD
jgi:hypothetical protein